ncbi:dipeptidase [Plastorhodobacter daqingensis]|uniref:Dipeptidase n=1 Tax=Plastorhodobacter daqingensis TaxID=1387281 RepID=A0ABW2UN55_9RHOB
MTEFPVFDGHNDLLLHLWLSGDRAGDGFFDGRAGHLDLPRARAGGFAGGFFASWIPNPEDLPEPENLAAAVSYPGLEPNRAARISLQMMGILRRMERARPDALQVCTSAADIEAARSRGAIAAIMHLEGCEGIGPDLDELHLFHAAGLRSLGPVWARETIFAHGVPFRFGVTPDIGPGLTDAGRRLVRECGALGILVDLSHLNEAGFWDVARISDRPLVATHSNVHALCPMTRNLTDRQLDAIAESKGLVGLNFATSFLRADGRKDAETSLDVPIAHLAYLLDKLGEDGVALGSDFDGAQIPSAIGSVAGLPALIDAMRKAGFGDPLIRRICWDNWLGLIGRVIG